MKKRLRKRFLLMLCSVIFVVSVMIVGCTDADRKTIDNETDHSDNHQVEEVTYPEDIFIDDPNYPRLQGNNRETYKMQQWEKLGYLDYVSYQDFLDEELNAGHITKEEMKAASKIGATPEQDSEATRKMVAAFTEKYESEGYTVVRLDGLFKLGTTKYRVGGNPALYAHKANSLSDRLVENLLS